MLGFKNISSEKFETKKYYNKLSLQKKVEISTLVRLMEVQKEDPKKDLWELLKTVAKSWYETVVWALNKNFDASLFDWNGKNSKDFWLKWTEAEIFDLFNDIQWNWLFDFSDSTLSAFKEIGKVWGMLGVWIVSWVIAGPIVVAAWLTWVWAAVATWMAIWATCTTAWALLNMQGYDTKWDATKDIWSDLVINSLLWWLWAWAIAKFGKDLSQWLSVWAIATNIWIEWTDFLAGTLAEKYRQELVLWKQANLWEMIQNWFVILMASKAGGKMVEKTTKWSAKDSQYYKSDVETWDQLVGNLAKITKEWKIVYNAKSVIEFGKRYWVDIQITKVDWKVLYNNKSFKQFLVDLKKDKPQCAIDLMKEMKRIKSHETMHRLLRNVESVEIDWQVYSQEKIAKIVSWNEFLPQIQLNKLEIELKKQIWDDFRLVWEDWNINTQFVRQYDTVNLNERNHSRLADSFMAEERLVKRYELSWKNSIDIEKEIDKVYLSDKEVRGSLDSMKMIEGGMEKMRESFINLLDKISWSINWIQVWEIKKWLNKFTEKWDSKDIDKIIWKITWNTSYINFKSWARRPVSLISNYTERLKNTVNQASKEKEKLVKNIEEHINKKELDKVINKSIEENKVEKLYEDFSNEIWRLHAGTNEKWKWSIVALRDINIVKIDWIRELKNFEMFIEKVDKILIDKTRVNNYKKEYVDNVISLIESHIKNEKISKILYKIKNNVKDNYNKKLKILKVLINKYL